MDRDSRTAQADKGMASDTIKKQHAVSEPVCASRLHAAKSRERFESPRLSSALVPCRGECLTRLWNTKSWEGSTEPAFSRRIRYSSISRPLLLSSGPAPLRGTNLTTQPVIRSQQRDRTPPPRRIVLTDHPDIFTQAEDAL